MSLYEKSNSVMKRSKFNANKNIQDDGLFLNINSSFELTFLRTFFFK